MVSSPKRRCDGSNNLDVDIGRLPEIRLCHGNFVWAAKGMLAACWAEKLKIAQVVFKPDWTTHR